MTKQEAKEQKRNAKKLARLFGHRDFVFTNSICVPGDGIVSLTVAVSWNGNTYEASGAAKRNMVDKWDENIGVEIATGRALLRIAYQILKDEQVQRQLENQVLVEEVKELFQEFQTMLGFKIYEDKTSALGEPSKVPGSRTYRGSEEQYGYGVIKPEVVPTGLEVIKEKLEDDRGDTAEGRTE